MIKEQIGIVPQDRAHFVVPLTQVVIITDAHLRTGGVTRGPDNIIKTIPVGEYPALYQCAGEEVVESGHTSFWWVLIATEPFGSGPFGWVWAALIEGGADGGEITGVPLHPTTFA